MGLAPRTIPPTDAVASLQERWRAAAPEDRAALLAEAGAEAVARPFAVLPLSGAPDDWPRPQALVTLVGADWWPAALLAAWVRPKRMLVLRTLRTDDDAPVLGPICQVSGVAMDAIEHQWLDTATEHAVYDEVRQFLGRTGLAGDAVAVDVTGGRRPMAVAGALAGFLAGGRLLYVDATEWDGDQSVPGTEYPRVIPDPLAALSDTEVSRICEAFNGGRFVDAEARAKDLAERLYEPWEGEAWRLLAQGYGAWHCFDFSGAVEPLSALRDLLDQKARAGAATRIRRVRPVLDAHLERLDALVSATHRPSSLAEGLPVVLNHLAAAERATELHDLDDAVLLLYSTVERYVDLCLWVDFGLDDRDPNYTVLDDHLDLERYHAIGAEVFEHYVPRPPGGPVLFRNGIQLLAALSPARLGDGHIGWLKGLGRMRNELTHGLIPTHPTKRQLEKPLARVQALITQGIGDAVDVAAELEAARFPRV